MEPIYPDAARKLADQLCAAKYVECSALTGKGLKELFDEAVFTAVLKEGKTL